MNLIMPQNADQMKKVIDKMLAEMILEPADVDGGVDRNFFECIL